MYRRSFLALVTALAAASGRVAANSSAAGMRRLKLKNAHTGETFDGPYRDESGPIPSALDDLSQLLRDHHSGAVIAVNLPVIDFLAAVMDAVGASNATVLSAYRTPATNSMLARTRFGVADNSQHLYGRALDVHLNADLGRAVAAARAMRRGGVGWYPNSGFFHIDTGPVRTWTLDAVGLDRLLLRVEGLLAREGLSVSSHGQLSFSEGRRPLSPKERLALHRVITKAARAGMPQ
jgi:uncharacterized protein YcbK (DUF882 family)